MPRTSSSGSSGGRSAPLSFKSVVFQTPRAPVALPSRSAVPAIPTYNPPPQMHSHQVHVQQPGFFSNMWQGFGLGAGQSIAFNMFRSDPKPVVVTAPAPTASAATEAATPTHLQLRIPKPSKEYIQCMEESKGDEDACRQFIESAGSN